MQRVLLAFFLMNPDVLCSTLGRTSVALLPSLLSICQGWYYYWWVGASFILNCSRQVPASGKELYSRNLKRITEASQIPVVVQRQSCLLPNTHRHRHTHTQRHTHRDTHTDKDSQSSKTTKDIKQGPNQKSKINILPSEPAPHFNSPETTFIFGEEHTGSIPEEAFEEAHR